MLIDFHLLDELTAQAKASPRLRQHYDLRNSQEDNSQRILNAMEPGTVLPIHRHMKSSETVVVLRGHLQEIFYDDAGRVEQVIDLTPDGPAMAISVPIGQWHNSRSLESGTVILECKDGKYEPLGEKDVRY